MHALEDIMKTNDSGVSPLASFFADRSLCRPDGPNSVNLFNAIHRLGGLAENGSDPETKALTEAIGERDHYLFVLIDGMGLNLESGFPQEGWFNGAERIDLTSTYPSTTAVALTSQASGLWPAEHGVTGWHTHLPDRGITVLPLRATERLSGKPIKQIGVPFREIVLPDSRLPRLTHGPRVFMKKSIKGGLFARWAFEGITRTGTKSVSQAFDRVRHHLRKVDSPSFTHLYLEDLDSLSHRKGPFSENVAALVTRIDRELQKLSETIGGKVRIIVSADHGHIEVPRNRTHMLSAGDPLLDLLVVPPSGESRNPIFHVLKNREEEFAAAFRERYGGDFLLVEPAAIESERLMGPLPLADVTRSRLGAYVGLAKGPAALEFIPQGGESKRHRGMHGGLSKDEIQVPLFLR